MKKTLFISFFLLSIASFAQKKTLQTKIITDKISIDGKLNETIWNTVAPAKDFIMFAPDNGKPIPENKRTEVKVLYDNDAIYIGALLYDNEPDKILREIAQRDDFGTADLFGIFINGFNDGQQDFQFYISASDGQADCIATSTTGEDYSWDAVWESKAVITEMGWVVEVKIPYAALRFSGENKQTWGLNFFREIRRDRQRYSWNFIDSKIGAFTQQTGILEGIENIKPPTRLFLLPYSSFYVNANAQQKTTGTLKGGMDIKYGINDAFTLDMILIPDFGQTKFDDQILNLGPFEQQFNENRPFFTEGTDLFNKGNLVYSRRIGGNPSKSPNPASDETVIDNPSSVNLINALKVSGRTKEGLGIGFLNAVTEKTFATIQNNTTLETRREVVEPLANYNVLVLDQRFHKNSSVSLVNTSVVRNAHSRDANVSALVWDLNTTKNTYNLSGNVKYSNVNDTQDKEGLSMSSAFEKTSGKYRFGFGSELVTKDYDNNDLGINFETNYYAVFGFGNYRILNPTKLFNGFRVNFNIYNQFQKETGKIQGNNLNMSVNIDTKKNHFIGFGFDTRFVETYDYYETRTANRFVILPVKLGGFIYLSSNYNYKFAIDFNPSIAVFNELGRNSYGFSVGPRYRFNDRLAVNYNYSFFQQNNNKGFVDNFDGDNNPSTENEIIFANRKVVTYSTSLSAKYSINSRMNFNTTSRYYWSFAENNNYLSLQQDGRLIDYTTYTANKNSNFNSWNVDLSFSWWFAPGSQLSVLYRNNAATFQREIEKEVIKNAENLFKNGNLNHSFSISVKYFIDYNQAKNWL